VVLDVATQGQRILNQAQIFAISAEARSRINTATSRQLRRRRGRLDHRVRAVGLRRVDRRERCRRGASR